ncbi:hypothetical protein OG874_39685 [Nocardia sp. NBC_00565]|uniref:hypothetical protein n=1 Tax=Nocardia sp. NBC_00565 TaxID=2975993 RepID=UPI002E81308D|nr:hypothetical protein [Nocardia sp. NBC_00565]WUC02758.1 hypothetical protein OG874_39685 [Nocardia sp. NBC_00565]
MASTQQATPARRPRKGKKSGPVTEYCALWHIKPGHAEQVIDEIAAGLSSRGDVRDMYKKIGVHDARYVVLDNGTRLLITISFDLDFDPYFDDAIASLVGGDKSQIKFDWMNHLVEAPEGGYDSMSWEAFKNWLVETQTEADIFANTNDATVQEIDKALRVQQAFQQVLDHPEAAQALQHPALKPLLEEAAG